jgi:hypothetical protein
MLPTFPPPIHLPTDVPDVGTNFTDVGTCRDVVEMTRTSVTLVGRWEGRCFCRHPFKQRKKSYFDFSHFEPIRLKLPFGSVLTFSKLNDRFGGDFQKGSPKKGHASAAVHRQQYVGGTLMRHDGWVLQCGRRCWYISVCGRATLFRGPAFKM